MLRKGRRYTTGKMSRRARQGFAYRCLALCVVGVQCPHQGVAALQRLPCLTGSTEIVEHLEAGGLKVRHRQLLRRAGWIGPQAGKMALQKLQPFF